MPMARSCYRHGVQVIDLEVWAGGGFVSSAPLALKSIETDGCGGVARNDLCLEGEADGGVVVGPGTAGLKVMAREESDS